MEARLKLSKQRT
jgi:hypothetical protein